MVLGSLIYNWKLNAVSCNVITFSLQWDSQILNIYNHIKRYDQRR